MLDFDTEREILKLYKSCNNFRDFVRRDIHRNFFGLEFADFNDIDGHKILSILVNDVKGVAMSASEEAGTQGVMRSNVILYCRYEDISGLNKNQPIRINGDLYTVLEFHDIKKYAWRIVLERNE